MRARENEHCLIGVRQQNLLIFALRSWVEADDGALSFFYFFDHPASIVQDGDSNFIPQRRNVACRFAVFQLPPQLANNQPVSGLNREETGLGFDD